MSEQIVSLPRTCEACAKTQGELDSLRKDIATTRGELASAQSDLLGLNDRTQTLEHSCSRMREAFVKNDLGNPDYDGHRVAHASAIDKAKVVSGYQRDMTKKVLEWILVAVGVLIGQGALEWIKAHLK